MKTFLGVFVLFNSLAFAGSITLTLTNITLSTTPGGTVTFMATATNNTAGDLNFNFDSFTVPSPLTLNDSGFLNNWLGVSANGTFGPSVLFSITVPLGTPTGLYSGGVFNILGGSALDSQELLGSAGFAVDVVDGASPAPEPSPGLLLLLAAGVFAAAGYARR